MNWRDFVVMGTDATGAAVQWKGQAQTWQLAATVFVCLVQPAAGTPVNVFSAGWKRGQTTAPHSPTR